MNAKELFDTLGILVDQLQEENGVLALLDYQKPDEPDPILPQVFNSPEEYESYLSSTKLVQEAYSAWLNLWEEAHHRRQKICTALRDLIPYSDVWFKVTDKNGLKWGVYWLGGSSPAVVDSWENATARY
jgi:hypothetical protein